MGKEKNEVNFAKKFHIFPQLIILAVCILGIGYGVMNVSFEIGGTAEADKQEGIVITEATQSDSTNATGEIEYYISNIFKSTIILSDSDSTSSITYEITIENTYDEDYWFDYVNVGNDSTYYTNDEIEYTLDGLEEGDKLEAGGTVTFTLNFSYADGVSPSEENNSLTSYLQFVFSRGSITITVQDSDGYYFTDGEFTIYEVATMYIDDDNSVEFVYTDDFSHCSATLDITDTGLAPTLADFVESQGIEGTTGAIGSSGSVTFSGLECGLYLIIQTGESAYYDTVSPEAWTVPFEFERMAL